MNTNPYDPPRAADEPRKSRRFALLAVVLLILFSVGLSWLLVSSSQTIVVPDDSYEVYESMSAE